MTKRCPVCECVKPLDEFYRLARSKDGRQGYCKSCANAKRLEWKKSNRDRERQWAQNARGRLTPERRRDRALRRKYHISLDEYEAMLQEQGGGCATCGARPEQPLAVDHDHRCCSGRTTCGRCIRGLLCFKCNAALGNVNDSKEILVNLIDYLDKGTPDQCEPVWGN